MQSVFARRLLPLAYRHCCRPDRLDGGGGVEQRAMSFQMPLPASWIEAVGRDALLITRLGRSIQACTVHVLVG